MMGRHRHSFDLQYNIKNNKMTKQTKFIQVLLPCQIYNCINTPHVQVVIFFGKWTTALSTVWASLGMFLFFKWSGKKKTPLKHTFSPLHHFSKTVTWLPGNRSSGTGWVQYSYISHLSLWPCYVHHDRAQEKALRQDHIYHLKRLVGYVMDMNLFSILFKASMCNLLPSPAVSWCQWVRCPVCARRWWDDSNLSFTVNACNKLYIYMHVRNIILQLCRVFHWLVYYCG